MKCFFLIFSLFFLSNVNAQSTAGLGTAGLGNADPAVFTRYRIPSTVSHGFTVNGIANLSLTNDNVMIDPSMPNNNSSINNYQARLNPVYFLFDESEDRIINFWNSLSASYSKNHNEQPESHYDNSSRNADLNFNSQFDYKNYFIAANSVYTNINGTVSLMMDDNRYESNSPSQQTLNTAGSKDQIYSIAAGVGFGRMRNVTPVVNAIRFQERLKQLNKINTDLPEDVIVNIAQQFSRWGEYTQVYSRPEKYFWGDMSDILSRNGVALTDMNLYSLSYLQEVLNELILFRLEGYDAGVNIKADYTNNYRMSEQWGSPRRADITESLFTGINFYFDYSHQLSLNSQFSFSASAFAAPNVLSHPDYKQRYEINITPAYGYELTDWLVFTAKDQLTYLQVNSRQTRRNTNNLLSLGMNYFLEDNISLAFNYNWLYTNNKIDNYDLLNGHLVNAEEDLSSHSISLGVTYYLDRTIKLL